MKIFLFLIRKLQKKSIFCFTATILIMGTSMAQLPAYLNKNAPIQERIDDALSRMTLEEKIALCHAQSKFSSAGVARLGIPELWCTDGPHGIRPEVLWDEWEQARWTNDSCTAFPALTCLAATWNRNLSLAYGQSIGAEARYRNKDILLGPGINIYRTPLNGRNFEYMGEDPYLAAQMVVPYIKGVQQNGVAACVKHFALNNQDTERHTTNVVVDNRALYEIYLPAFKAAVQEGDSWSIMGAYNLYRGQQGCHNEYLLNDILRKEWNYKGVVISDWGGTHNTMQAIYNGLDLEFGTWTDGLSSGASNSYENYHLAQPYLKLIKEGKVGTKELDEKVRRILRLIFHTSMNTNKPFGAMGAESHIQAARTIAQEGIVLLQNRNGVLPIPTATQNILVVGENAIKKMTVGGGSSSLKARYEILPLEGIQKRMPNANIQYARGYVGDSSGEYNGVVTGQNLDDKRSAEELTAEAIEMAKSADYVIFIGGLNKSSYQDCEDTDRKEYNLPYAQSELISKLAKVNKNTVVINISGNAVAMPFVQEVPAIVQSWYLGSETGHAIADVLFGDVNPSGKLPFSILKRLEDYPSHSISQFPGVNGELEYKESIFVGYRHVDREKKITPQFAFGHGLSYTTFTYGKAIISNKKMSSTDTVTVTIDVTNSGNRAGAEVVQLYIGDKKSSLPRPIKELKGFEKVWLEAGQTKTVHFTINKEALSFFDDTQHLWVAEAGTFTAFLGTSSADIRGSVVFDLIK